VGALLLGGALDDLRGDRLDVGDIRRGRVGQDRRRTAVDEDEAVALLAQRLAGVGAGIVEVAGLAEGAGTRADDEDALEVGTFGHFVLRLLVRGRLPSAR